MGSVICKVSATQLGDKTVGRIVGPKTLGDEELVKRQFEGLVRCMRDGTEADGMARQIGGWVTVYPVFVGPIDWVFGEVMVCTNEGVYGPSTMMLGIYSDDGTCLKINPDSGSIPPGTYANATINIMGLKHGETEPVILHIPINLVVEA